MRRLAGDPSIAGWLLFAIGFRLPPENREWVRHELTDAGWRGRDHQASHGAHGAGLRRARLPARPGLAPVAVPAFALIASVGTVLISADDVRAARLKQHGLEVPTTRPRPPTH